MLAPTEEAGKKVQHSHVAKMSLDKMLGSVKTEPKEDADGAAMSTEVVGIVANEDDLVPLLPNQQSKRRFPPGCPVWFGFSNPSTKQLDAAHGVVKAVHTNIEAGGFVYEVGGGPKGVFLTEDQLAFAGNCPVRVKGVVEKEPGRELEGRIVCPKPGRGGRKLTYTVQFTIESGRVRIEMGIESEQISYRAEDRPSEGKASKEKTDTSHQSEPMQANDYEGRGTEVSSSSTGTGESSSEKARDRLEAKVSAEDMHGAAKSSSCVEGQRENGPTNMTDRTDVIQGASKDRVEGATKNELIKNDVPAAISVERPIELPSPKLNEALSAKRKQPASETSSRDESPTKLARTSPANVSPIPNSLTHVGSAGSIRRDAGDGNRKVWKHSCSRKLYIPVDSHPRGGAHFMGLVLGPRGKTQRELEGRTGCKVAIRGRGSNSRSTEGDNEPLHVLITGDCPAAVDAAAKAIEPMLVVMDDRENVHKQKQLRELALLNGTLKDEGWCTSIYDGRRQQKDEETPHSKSCQPVPQQLHRGNEGGGDGRVRQRDAANLKLAVPLWATQDWKDKRDFFRENYLLDHCLCFTPPCLLTRLQSFRWSTVTEQWVENNVSENSRCTIKVTQEGAHASPLIIYIESAANSFMDVRLAKGMVESVLFRNLGDANSNMRLLYELALTGGGNYNFGPRSSDGIVFQYCSSEKKPLFMKLLNLPWSRERGAVHAHGDFILLDYRQKGIIGNSSCWLEVYGFECMPVKCPPYLVVWGHSFLEVGEVAGRVFQELDKHRSKCMCRY